jgi:hypothetical protein
MTFLDILHTEDMPKLFLREQTLQAMITDGLEVKLIYLLVI